MLDNRGINARAIKANEIIMAQLNIPKEAYEPPKPISYMEFVDYGFSELSLSDNIIVNGRAYSWTGWYYGPNPAQHAPKHLGFICLSVLGNTRTIFEFDKDIFQVEI